MSLDILKVKSMPEYDKRFENICTPLLRPPFLIVANGSVRTGKSTIMMNFIYNKHFYHGLFDKIIFISPTVNNDVTLKHLHEDEDIIKISDGLDDLDGILKTIVEEKEKDDDDRKEFYLIILDDCLGYIKPKSYVTYLCARYRHFKISLIITTQNFRSIPNVIRTNATAYLLFKTTNKKEYQKYVEEFSGLFKDFDKLYSLATFLPYHFLYLDLRNVHAYSDFKELLA